LWLAFARRVPDWDRGEAFLGYCFLCALTGPFLSRAALMYALKHMPANRVTLLSLITPAITLIPSFIVFHTLPTLRECFGSLVMVIGVALPVLESSAAVNESPKTLHRA
jgi:drug/metabolite transporter (DMT)-like permease